MDYLMVGLFSCLKDFYEGQNVTEDIRDTLICHQVNLYNLVANGFPNFGADIFSEN